MECKIAQDKIGQNRKVQQVQRTEVRDFAVKGFDKDNEYEGQAKSRHERSRSYIEQVCSGSVQCFWVIVP